MTLSLYTQQAAEELKPKMCLPREIIQHYDPLPRITFLNDSPFQPKITVYPWHAECSCLSASKMQKQHNCLASMIHSLCILTFQLTLVQLRLISIFKVFISRCI